MLPRPDSYQEVTWERLASTYPMSLDGFITGPSEGPDNGLGDGGERLHDWMFDGKSDPDAEVVDEVYARTGAIIIAKRMFDVGVGP
jgi:hypothetical protein